MPGPGGGSRGGGFGGGSRGSGFGGGHGGGFGGGLAARTITAVITEDRADLIFTVVFSDLADITAGAADVLADCWAC